MSNIWDQIEENFSVERKSDSQKACGVHCWIIAHYDGTREIKPYHCGTCEDCKSREGLKLKTLLYSIAYVNDLKFMKAPPAVVDRIIKDMQTQDYARFPSDDGFDYLFSLNGAGKDFFSSEPDWQSIVSRREGTRKTGKLVVFKKEKPETTIPLRDIRTLSYEIAVGALEEAREAFEKDGLTRIIDSETDLVVSNNIITAFILETVEENGGLVFSHALQRECKYPVEFGFRIKDSTENKHGQI